MVQHLSPPVRCTPLVPTKGIIWQARKRTEKSKKDGQQCGVASGREERKWTVLLQFGKEMTDERYARVFKP